MPSVIVLTGHPCSGKTTLAGQIRKRALEHPSRRINNVVILNEASACPDDTLADCYGTSAAEKATRGALKASFDRAVSAATTSTMSTGSGSIINDSTLIILDSTNYIKGYRYELYCISKAASCRHCVVWCLNSVETVVEWNSARRQHQDDHPDAFYSDDLLQALILRYEPPDERNRWDKPLFRIDMHPPTTTATTTTTVGRQVLDRSVYNMHNLAGTMGGTASAAVTFPSSSDAPAAKTSSLFKRSSTFKKRDKVKESGNSSAPLTAESLSLLSSLSIPPNPSNDTLNPDDASSRHVKVDVAVPTTVHDHQMLSSAPSSTTIVESTMEPLSLEEHIDNFLEEFLFSNQASHQLRQGTSTRQHVATDSDVLHKVDSVTQQVCAIIQSATTIETAPHWARDVDWLLDQCVAWQNRTTAPELRRIRQQYIQWVATHPPEPNDKDDVGDDGCRMERSIARSFLAYIESSQQSPTK